MGKKVAFATTNWKDRPNKPNNKTQAEWDAEGSSCFSGFPFPVFVGKKYQNGGVNHYLGNGTVLSKISSPQTVTRVTEYNVVFTSMYEPYYTLYFPNGYEEEPVLDFQLISGPAIVSFAATAIIDGWMEMGPTITVNAFGGLAEDSKYDYPEYNFIDLPPGINTSRREMIDSKFGFIGPFSRQDITRLWWTAQNGTLGTQYTYSTGNSRSFSNTFISTANYDEINNKLKGPFELVVFDVDSEDDFYIKQGNVFNGEFLSPIPNKPGGFYNEAFNFAQDPINSTFTTYVDYEPYTLTSEGSVGYKNTMESSLLFSVMDYVNVLYHSHNNQTIPVINSYSSSFELRPGTVVRKRETEVFTVGHINPFSNYTRVASWEKSFANPLPPEESEGAPRNVCALRSWEIATYYEELNVPFTIYEGRTINVKVNRKRENTKTIEYQAHPVENGTSSFYDAGCQTSTPYPSVAPVSFTSAPQLKMMKFLEYDDGNGNPIYDKNTGAMLRDPVTGVPV